MADETAQAAAPAMPDAPASVPVEAAPAASEEQPAKPPAQPAAGGEIVVTGRQEIAADPLADLNAKSYEAIQAVEALRAERTKASSALFQLRWVM